MSSYLISPDTGNVLRRKVDRLPIWSAPIASALVPGLGQARLGKDRFVGYMAAEAFLVLQYVKNAQDGRSAAASYRSIARDVARRNFPGTHPDTAWQYYEKVKSYLESGVFSRATSGATLPETDELTYNGAQWDLARRVYGIPLDDPDPSGIPSYAAAVTYYESRAIPLAYGWSWENAQLEKDLYVRMIARSNDSYRRATADLVALIANHILSSIDAFATVRLMQGTGASLRVSTSFPLK